MHEGTQGIFDYLPIRRDAPENDYINHLWQAFSTLGTAEDLPQPFAVMPFHLLFMMAIQYKVLRIYKEHKEKYDLALTTKNPRSGEMDILSPESPLAIAFLGESEIVDLLKIVGLSSGDARDIKKSIVRYRNDKIAHAKGYIEQAPVTKIGEYFHWLEAVQIAYQLINQKMADNWLKEIDEGDNIDQFLESRFLDTCLCPRDFGDMMPVFLDSSTITFDQWQDLVLKGMEYCESATIITLKSIALNCDDDELRFNSIQTLDVGEYMDESFYSSLLTHERDKGILEYLKKNSVKE
jgi:hypothetical protein